MVYLTFLDFYCSCCFRRDEWIFCSENLPDLIAIILFLVNWCYSILTSQKEARIIMTSTVAIYTDGACSGNPGPGGFGAILAHNGHEKEISGSEPETTNNRMELTGAIAALEMLKKPCKVELFSDSAYMTKGMNDWMKGWQANGWKNSRKKPVLNADLWQKLLTVSERHEVMCTWTKGHAGHPMNERASKLASRAASEAAAESQPKTSKLKKPIEDCKK